MAVHRQPYHALYRFDAATVCPIPIPTFPLKGKGKLLMHSFSQGNCSRTLSPREIAHALYSPSPSRGGPGGGWVKRDEGPAEPISYKVAIVPDRTGGRRA